MSDPLADATGLAREDREELADLCRRYAAAADSREFGAFGELFTADGVLISTRGRYEGRVAIVAGVSGLARYDRTFHFVGQIRHWVEDGAVRGETYCVAHHFTDADGGGARDRVLYIRYRDECRREGGAWRFARRELGLVQAGQEDKPPAEAPPGQPAPRRVAARPPEA